MPVKIHGKEYKTVAERVAEAHKCFPPYKDGDYKKVESVTDIVNATLQLKQLNEG